MNRKEAVEILSDMRAEYNLFGGEEEATRYHVLSMAIQALKGDIEEEGDEVVAHCNLKENAELIAKILDADVNGEVWRGEEDAD